MLLGAADILASIGPFLMQKLLERTTKKWWHEFTEERSRDIESESVKTGDYDLKLKIPDKAN